MPAKQKPSLGESLKQLTDSIHKDSGSEIVITEHGAEIAWENLRVNCDEKAIAKAAAAVCTLQELGAFFV